MRDPSLLVTRPTASDPTLAPDGRDLLYVLAPAPNLDRGRVDWDADGNRYVDNMIGHVQERLMPGLRDHAKVLDVVTPADWARQGMAAGSPLPWPTPSCRPARSVRPTWCAVSTMRCWPAGPPCLV